ncbi:uncharacterized protein LOC132042446, partial [Lycium ferocissimum]|uniref:uncharacterized protein LOC132042446 n=1 Tax=Lycium ferocissimum TaxID=112874 RepID=UPI002814E804
MAPFEALHERKSRSPIGWYKVGEVELLGLDLVHQVMEKVKLIQERLKTTQSHQKSYSGIRDLEFQVEDCVFLNVSPMKGFGFRAPSFHVSMLKKCVGDPSLIVPVDTIIIKDILAYEDILVATLDRQVHKLRTKEVASVK